MVGGEYTIKAYNSYQIVPVMKLIRIRDYPRDSLVVKVNLPFESYRPGDTVTGTIKAEIPDGTAFESVPSFQFSANFELTDPTSG